MNGSGSDGIRKRCWEEISEDNRKRKLKEKVSLVLERKSLIKISDKLSENPVILTLTRILLCLSLLLKAGVLVFHSKILVAGGCMSDSARSF